MKPPPDGENSADTTTDELLARVIPLRHRSTQPHQPHTAQEPAPPTDPPAPRGHSLWDPAPGGPQLRRRTPATAAGHTPPWRIRLRASDAITAGVAAILATIAVLALGGLLNPSTPAPRTTRALQPRTATQASTATHHPARPHNSSQNHPPSRARRTRAHAQRQRTTTPAPTGAAPLSTPASTGAPTQAPSGPGEFTFER